MTASHFLHTHLQFIRHTITMARNTELLASMKAQLEGKAKAEEGKKTVKAQDIVRMYENMIQNLLEVPTLPGLEEDEELAASTKAKVKCCKIFLGQELLRHNRRSRAETNELFEIMSAKTM